MAPKHLTDIELEAVAERKYTAGLVRLSVEVVDSRHTGLGEAGEG